MSARVLVVDDHEDAMLLFVDELVRAGYDVAGTTSSNDALNLAITSQPQVIVTDIAMPDVDGYELAKLVRSYAATRTVRLVAVTAYPFETSSEHLPPGGWDAFLSKPVEPGALARIVGNLLAASSSRPS